MLVIGLAAAALRARIEKADIVCDAGETVVGTDAAIYRDADGYFGVVETMSDEIGSTFEVEPMDFSNAVSVELIARSFAGSERTRYLANAIIPGYRC